MGCGTGVGQGEELGLIGLDGVEEGGVVGGTVGGDLAAQEVDVTGGGDGAGIGVVAGGEGGVVAVDDGAGGKFDAGAGWKMEGYARLHVERGAQVDRRCFVGVSDFAGKIGYGQNRERSGDAHRFLGPVHELGL